METSRRLIGGQTQVGHTRKTVQLWRSKKHLYGGFQNTVKRNMDLSAYKVRVSTIIRTCLFKLHAINIKLVRKVILFAVT